MACPASMAKLELLLGGCRLARRRVAEHRMGVIAARVKHSERQRSDHEDDRCPRGKPCKQVCGCARTKRSLRALATKSAGEICGTPLLHEDHSNEKYAHKNVYKH